MNISTREPSVLGGTMIVSGTAIGAGMLALPMISAGMWFYWSILLLLCCWGMMLLSSQALLEVQTHYEPGSSFHTLVKDTLGPVWSAVNGASVAFVLYILTYAYISGGGSVLRQLLTNFLGFAPPQSIVGLLLASVLAFCVWRSAWVVDRLSVIMMGGMIIAFLVLLFDMLVTVRLDVLIDTEGSGPYTIFIFVALSTFLTSFCFHASVPSLVKYFGPVPHKINKCLVYGTCITLLSYMAWLLVCDGNIPRAQFKEIIAAGGNVGDLVNAAGSTGGVVAYLLAAFSFLAIATSFLGVGLGLFDYIADLCKFDNSIAGRTKTSLVTFLPSLFAAFIWPNGFLYAIGWAGVAATIWSVIIPACMLRACRKKFAKGTFTTPGGNATIYALLFFGALTALCHTLAVFNILPMYK